MQFKSISKLSRIAARPPRTAAPRDCASTIFGPRRPAATSSAAYWNMEQFPFGGTRLLDAQLSALGRVRGYRIACGTCTAGTRGPSASLIAMMMERQARRSAGGNVARREAGFEIAPMRSIVPAIQITSPH